MRPIAVLALTLAFALAAFALPARAEVRVFELGHATPESLLPVVQPLLGPYESVSAYRNSLVVNASGPALERIGALLAELDRPLRNLQITLRRRSGATAGAGGYGVQGRISTGDVAVSTGARSADGLTVTTTRTRTTRGGGGEQTLRALEGSTVLIREGELVPLVRGGHWGPELDYAELERGFTVSARVSGETVTLTIDARDDNNRGARVESALIGTTVSGPLGAWIPLAGTGSTEAATATGTGARWSTREASASAWELRVELAP